MTNEDYYRAQVHELDKRLTTSEHLVLTTPLDCASAKANLREYLREDLETLHQEIKSPVTALDIRVRDTLLERINQMQIRRRTAIGTIQ